MDSDDYRFPWETEPCESRALRHIAHMIVELRETLMSDLSAITNAVEAESSVVDSAVTLLTQLLADVQASKNDPVAIQAIVDSVTAQTATLAAAVAANTPVADGTAPAPVDPSAGMTTTQS